MRVAVLGAGIQGACAALELASAGIQVDLYDKNDKCMTQASAQNEGKLHLGYVYGNDRSLATARTLIKGAISFSPSLRQWLGSALDTIPVSTPFNYVVHANSMLTVSTMEAYFGAAQALAVEESQGVPLDYFGSDYCMPPARIPDGECDALYDRAAVAAAFRTGEISIDCEVLASLMRDRLAADSHIRCVLRALVISAAPQSDGVTVTFEVDGSRQSARYDHVVNALWDGRLAVDRTAGIQPPRPWLFRIKHFLRLSAPGSHRSVPSTTTVLGPFGDVVAYPNGTLDLSWYPVGMRGLSSEITPPDWPRVLDPATALEVRDGIMQGLTGIVPSLARLPQSQVETSVVLGGIIFAWGSTDITDPLSFLHERQAIGPQSEGRYHTVDTGKYSMAPMFAKIVSDRIRQSG
jgi:hypothetical protein